MRGVRTRRVQALAMLLMAVATLGAGRQDKNWKPRLKAALELAYPPTLLARQFIARTGPVEKPGIILVVKKPGLVGSDMDLAMLVRPSTVKNGALTRIHQTSTENHYVLKSGDRVFVGRIDVDDDSVALRLFTADPIETIVKGSTQSSRFEAHLRFEFDKTFLRTANIVAIQTVIGEFVASEEAAARTKIVELGQTMVEVERILGTPDTVIKLGAKVVHVYKNIRIVFTNGKVTDVQ